MGRPRKIRPEDLEDQDLPETGSEPQVSPSTDFAGEDDRLRKAFDGQRRSRAADDPDLSTDRGSGLASNSRERRRSFRDEWTQEALPKLPPIPGYHLCWLSTTNQWDPIERRMRMGYTPVKPEEAMDFEHLTMKSGQWEGFIGINEMLLFKLPAAIYQEVMAEFHHEQPLDEEANIRVRSENIAEDLRDSDGTSLVELEPDMKALGKRPRRNPVFNP